MTSARGLLAALALSLVLHAALAVALRGLGLGPSGPERLPPLYVDLVEPVVAQPGLAPRPVRRATRASPSRGPDAAPAAPVVAPAPVVEVPPPAAPPVVGPPPSPPSSTEGAPRRRPEPTVVAGAPPAPSPEIPSVDAVDGARAVGPPVVGSPTPPTSSTGRDAAAGPPARGSAGKATGPDVGRGPPAGSDGGGAKTGGGRDAAGPTAALPSGHAGAVPPEYDAYVRALRRRIQERLVYPWRAVSQGIQGTVELEVQLDAAGRVSGVAVVGRPGAPVLGDAAVEAVREATPFPFPPGLAGRALTIRLPVVFELR